MVSSIFYLTLIILIKIVDLHTVRLFKVLLDIYKRTISWYIFLLFLNRGVRGVIVIVVGNEHGDTSSNPGRNSLYFT